MLECHAMDVMLGTALPGKELTMDVILKTKHSFRCAKNGKEKILDK